MSKQLKKQLTLKGREVAPHLDTRHLQRALFLALIIFALSLATGLLGHSLFFLIESLLIITLCWGIYRRNFASILILSVYLFGAKTYQLFALNDYLLSVRVISLVITLLLIREVYLGSQKATKEEVPTNNLAGLFDLIFVLMISLTTFSLSTFAMELIK